MAHVVSVEVNRVHDNCWEPSDFPTVEITQAIGTFGHQSAERVTRCVGPNTSPFLPKGNNVAPKKNGRTEWGVFPSITRPFNVPHHPLLMA